MENTSSQQVGWELKARSERVLLSTVQAKQDGGPKHHGCHVVSPGWVPHFLQFFNWKNWMLIRLSLSLTSSLAFAIWQSLTHNLNELLAFLLYFLTYIKISGSPW